MDVATGFRSMPAARQFRDSLRDRNWRSRLDELRRFVEDHGHANVPRRWPQNPGLSFWVINQRRLRRFGRLPADRLGMLEALGISWSTADDRIKRLDQHWTRLCNALHAFLRAQGHCDVPEGWTADPELARWAARQRRMKRAGTLRADRLRCFEECGIDWTQEGRRSRIRDRAWDRRFYQLREFKRLHGSCDVPRSGSDHAPLARWVSRQRFLMRRCGLRPDRRNLLESLGFTVASGRPAAASVLSIPGPREQAWLDRYRSLVRFHAAEGHSDVPRRLPSDPGLARWASHQRDLRRRDRVSRNHIELLDRVQFPWSGRDGLERARDAAWEQACSRLLAYRKVHGHCDVPARWKEDAALGRWVAAQRARHRRGRLKAERVRLLESLGFRWHD